MAAQLISVDPDSRCTSAGNSLCPDWPSTPKKLAHEVMPIATAAMNGASTTPPNPRPADSRPAMPGPELDMLRVNVKIDARQTIPTADQKPTRLTNELIVMAGIISPGCDTTGQTHSSWPRPRRFGHTTPTANPVALPVAQPEVEGAGMAATLDRAIEASEIVDALKPFGISQLDVAAVTQVSDRAVRGWRTNDIRADRYDQLAQLRDLVLLLSDSLTPRGVGQWLHAMNRLLDGQRPIDLLAQDHYDEVRSAAEAFIDGSYV